VEGRLARSPATLTSEEEQAGLPAAPPPEGEEALAAGLLRRRGTKDMLRACNRLFLLSAETSTSTSDSENRPAQAPGMPSPAY